MSAPGQNNKHLPHLVDTQTANPPASYQNVVQELYLAYLGRPADPAGLANFESALAAANAPTDVLGLSQAYSTNPAVKSLIDLFSLSKESQNLYEFSGTSAYVSTIFQNVIGRQPQSSGLNFWVNQIGSGAVPYDDAALAIMAGAETNVSTQGLLDQQLISARLSSATYFTALVTSRNATANYVGLAAAGAARSMIAGVTGTSGGAADQANAGATVAALIASATGANAANSQTVAVGGTLIGLPEGASLQLGNDNFDYVTLNTNGSFFFAGALNAGQAYNVQVVSSPPGFNCSVGAGSGIIGSASVNSVNIACSAVAASAPAVPNLQVFAGRLASGDGIGNGASFAKPFGVATDAAGNVYVADCSNNAIRKITPASVVTTLAGSLGNKGSADGVGAAAGFSCPWGIAVDSGGNLYVSDSGNNTIRAITPGGQVSTLAGSAGVSGNSDGTGSAASFSQPRGIAVGADGSVYVVDGFTLIRKIAPGGLVSTFSNGSVSLPLASSQIGLSVTSFGSNPSVGTVFQLLGALAIDGSGNLYASDTESAEVFKIDGTGFITPLAGSKGAFGYPLGIRTPSGLAVDQAGNVYVADSVGNTVSKFTPGGNMTQLAGIYTTPGSINGPGAGASFNTPMGVAVDASGDVLVADSANNLVRVINSAGYVTTLAGSDSAGNKDGIGTAALFNLPQGMAPDGAGNLYVADSGNGSVRKISPTGSVSTAFSRANFLSSTGAQPEPIDVALDTKGNIYVVAGNGLDSTYEISPGGTLSTYKAGCTSPVGITFDSSGNYYCSDSVQESVYQVSPGGTLNFLGGTRACDFTDSNVGTQSASFCFYEGLYNGLTVDSAGNVYLIDYQAIRKITPAHVVSTFAGVANVIGSADGVGTAARFNNPQGLTIDGNGNLYVADTGNNTVRKITPAGVVTTLVGVAGKAGFMSGALPGGLWQPIGLAIVGSKLYISNGNGIAILTNLP